MPPVHAEHPETRRILSGVAIGNVWARASRRTISASSSVCESGVRTATPSAFWARPLHTPMSGSWPRQGYGPRLSASPCGASQNVRIADDSGVCECDESRVTRDSEGHFAHYGRPTSPTKTQAAVPYATLARSRCPVVARARPSASLLHRSGQRERVGDDSVALGFERLVAGSVGPCCGAYGLADSVAVPRVRLSWIGPVPVEECCLKFHVA